MNESQVWGKFKKMWPLPCDRQEPGIGSGQPDVLTWDLMGIRHLIELKRPDKVQLRPSQWIWHEKDQANGAWSCVLTCFYHRKNLEWDLYRIHAKERKLVREVSTSDIKTLMYAAQDVMGVAWDHEEL